jgi:hypothetical protein
MNNSKIVVHGFEDWSPTPEQWQEMLDTVQIGANGECDVTINGLTKTMREWQNDCGTKFAY